jgi:hypothetical protein
LRVAIMTEASESTSDIPYDADRILFDQSMAPPDPVSRRMERPVQPGYRQQGDITAKWTSLINATLALTSPTKYHFQYTPLPRGSIRLIIIRPGRFEDQLELDLRVAALEDRLRYKALSYEWRQGPTMFEVVLRDYTRPLRHIPTAKGRLQFAVFRKAGTRFYVRQNLLNALRHLRDREKPIAMWVDAICINQADQEEKAEQIAQMATIYETAFNVNVWLGTSNEMSDRAMKFVTKWSDSTISHIHSLGRNGNLDQSGST